VGDVHAAEAQVIEQVLEGMGELREAGQAEHARQSLQRVNGPEDVVQQVWIGPALFLGLLEQQKVATQRLDDLLGLREEVLARAIVVFDAPYHGVPRTSAGRARVGLPCTQ
jgi:hypothetical protein